MRTLESMERFCIASIAEIVTVGHLGVSGDWPTSWPPTAIQTATLAYPDASSGISPRFPKLGAASSNLVVHFNLAEGGRGRSGA